MVNKKKLFKLIWMTLAFLAIVFGVALGLKLFFIIGWVPSLFFGLLCASMGVPLVCGAVEVLVDMWKWLNS